MLNRQTQVENCTECGKEITNLDEIEEQNYGVFCSSYCHAKYVLDDETFEEIYGEYVHKEEPMFKQYSDRPLGWYNR